MTRLRFSSVHRLLPGSALGLGLLIAASGPVAAQAEERPIGVWVTAGSGLGSAGVAGVLGGSVAAGDWSALVRYAKTQAGGGSAAERYSEHYALLVGRAFGADGRKTVAAGLSRSRGWETSYTPCGDCWFGDWRRGPTTGTGEGLGVALAASARTRPFWVVAAASVEGTAFLASGATAIGVHVALDLGWPR